MVDDDPEHATDDSGIGVEPTKYEPRMHVVLFQPEIPYNTGSVGRTCVAVAAKLWLVRPLGFRVDDYYLRRAGLDYWQHLVWEVVDDWGALTAALPVERHWYFTKFGDRAYTSAGFTAGDVLVFGRESQGLPPEIVAGRRERCLRIPTRPEVRSLNLSNSAAVAMYEALRQWDG
ncbi:tRNA (cytidine(34)-2'-O)-methyltransferase [Lacipirellula limnantheis]|uniref:Putative tRNA (cytidine(34)-2'-O)-methyltransferase n=1 Tax=Lacipirellula limnantheis TaxID=2528024 RepID=A0A517TWT1_9BACT|nr:tRNA (cytidine(34)-2'-O)-methyltransferase [Lacipirellula limnantheis]QDT72820.1 tRNA (cytidine(34)-2'-O)-methyltransferase [Lacipirellula limnantheis]